MHRLAARPAFSSLSPSSLGRNHRETSIQSLPIPSETIPSHLVRTDATNSLFEWRWRHTTLLPSRIQCAFPSLLIQRFHRTHRGEGSTAAGAFSCKMCECFMNQSTPPALMSANIFLRFHTQVIPTQANNDVNKPSFGKRRISEPYEMGVRIQCAWTGSDDQVVEIFAGATIARSMIHPHSEGASHHLPIATCAPACEHLLTHRDFPSPSRAKAEESVS